MDLLYHLDNIDQNDKTVFTVNMARRAAVLKSRYNPEDTALLIKGYNAALNTNDPAILGYYYYPPLDLIDDSPIDMSVNDWNVYNDLRDQRPKVFGVGYKSDSAYVFRFDPQTEELQTSFLRPNRLNENAEHWDPQIMICLIGDYDFDGLTEAIIYFNCSRWGPVRELYCWEIETMRLEWKLPMSSTVSPRTVFDCRDSINPGIIVATYNPKQGVADSLFDDSYCYITRINGRGQLNFKYVTSVRHGRSILTRDDNQPGRFYLYHELNFLSKPPVDSTPVDSHFLSVVDARGHELHKIELTTRILRLWVMPYDGARSRTLSLWAKCIDNSILVYDLDLNLIARGEDDNLGDFLGEISLSGLSDSVLVFSNGLYSSEMQQLLTFPKGINYYDILTEDDLGNVSELVIGSGNWYQIARIDRKSIWEFFSIAYVNNKFGVIVVLTALFVSLIFLIINRFRTRANLRLIASQNRALEQAHAQLNTTLNAIPDFLLEIDLNGHIYLFRAPDPELFPFLPRQIIGKNLIDILPLPAAKTILQAIAEVDETGRTSGQSFSLDTSDHRRWYEISLASKGDQAENRERFIVLAHDITVRKKMEEDLQRSEETARALINATDDMALLVETDSKIVFFNDALAAFFGETPDNLIGRHAFDLFDPETRKARQAKAQEVMELRRSLTYEEVRDNSIITVSLHPILSATGEVERLAIFIRNVTAQRQYEETLRRSEETARALINSTEDMAILTDRLGNIIMLNDTAARILSTNKEEATGKNVFEHMDQAFVKARRERYEKIMAAKVPMRFEEPAMSNRIFYTTVYPVLDGQGEISRLAVFSQDITERKKAEIALQVSEERYRTLVDNLPVGVFRTTINGIVISANPAAKKMMNFNPDLHDEKEIDMSKLYVDPDRRRQLIEVLKRDGVINDFAVQVYDLNNNHIWTSLNATAITDDDGEIKYIDGLVVDIDARKKAEEALRKSEERYRTLQENIPVGVFRARPGGKVVSCNRAGWEMFGYDSEQDIKKSATVNQYGDINDQDRFRELMTRDGWVRDFEFLARCKNGELRWCSMSAMAMKDIEGNIEFFDGVIADIHDRKIVEEALKRSEERYRTLTENLPVGVFRSTPEGKIISVNSAGLNMMGFDKENDVLDEINLGNFYKDPEERRRLFEEVQRHGFVKNFVIKAGLGDNSERWISISATASYDDDRRLRYLDAAVEDITDRRLAEEELRRAHEELKKAQAIIVAQEKYKQAQDIAGGLAHEIHNALCPALNALDIIKRKGIKAFDRDPERLQELLHLCDFAVERATGLTQLVTGYSRLESERSELTVRLADVVDEVLSQNRLRLDELGLTPEVSLDHLPPISANPDHLYSLFNNLLLNSLDVLTGRAKPQIKVQGSTDDSHLLVEFFDNGPGIPELHRRRIFDLFYSTKPATGSGLGLSIAKKICEIYNAQIEVESVVDSHTRFIIKWPKPKPQE